MRDPLPDLRQADARLTGELAEHLVVVAQFLPRTGARMIEENDLPIRIMDLLKPHLVELPHGQRTRPVLHVRQVHVHERELARLEIVPCVRTQYLLRKRPAHRSFPFSKSLVDHPAGFYQSPGRPRNKRGIACKRWWRLSPDKIVRAMYDNGSTRSYVARAIQPVQTPSSCAHHTHSL